MFNATQYINSSTNVRLESLEIALEYSLIAEYNTHVVRLRSGIFLVTDEECAREEAEFGGRLLAVRGELINEPLRGEKRKSTKDKLG